MNGQITVKPSTSGSSALSSSVDGSVSSPATPDTPEEAAAILEVAATVESAPEAPVVDDVFIPFTETVFESLDESAEVREVETTATVREEFGGRLAGVFRGLQAVRRLLSEGNILGAASRLARLATVSRADSASLSRFREARVLLHYTESAQRSLASGDVDEAVLKLETGMGEVAAGAQEVMGKSQARSLVRGLAKVRASAREGNYDTAIAQARQMVGRYGDAELDDAFERVIRTLETIDQLRDLRTAGLSGRLVVNSQYSFTRLLDGLRGISRFAADRAAATEPREIDEAEPVDYAVPKHR